MVDSEWTGFNSHVEVRLFHKCAFSKRGYPISNFGCRKNIEAPMLNVNLAQFIDAVYETDLPSTWRDCF